MPSLIPPTGTRSIIDRRSTGSVSTRPSAQAKPDTPDPLFPEPYAPEPRKLSEPRCESQGTEVTPIAPQEAKALSWQASVTIVAIVIEMGVVSSDDAFAQKAFLSKFMTMYTDIDLFTCRDRSLRDNTPPPTCLHCDKRHVGNIRKCHREAIAVDVQYGMRV
ncbi:hypothetical protein EI94DRAFT_1799134 [Lactarius quietus]|nr:hypothetical protein EI94DRAFT_1799134 [Lactarius quietus]